jgi:2-oxoglutarate ferredoxin oxidoreductase subunit delta
MAANLDLPVHIDQSLCTGCELCVSACPQHVLRMVEDKSRLAGQVAWLANPDLCTGCMQCEDACPSLCIQVLAATVV